MTDKELKALKEKGADIVFVDALPAGVDGFSVVELENIAAFWYNIIQICKLQSFSERTVKI